MEERKAVRKNKKMLGKKGTSEGWIKKLEEVMAGKWHRCAEMQRVVQR